MAQLCVAAVSLLVQKLMGVVADLGLSAAKSPEMLRCKPWEYTMSRYKPGGRGMLAGWRLFDEPHMTSHRPCCGWRGSARRITTAEGAMQPYNQLSSDETNADYDANTGRRWVWVVTGVCELRRSQARPLSERRL